MASGGRWQNTEHASQNPKTPKSMILEARLMGDETSFIVHRRNFDDDDGIGMQGGTAQAGAEVQVEASYVWFRVVESKYSPDTPLNARWCKPLLLGERVSSSLLIEVRSLEEYWCGRLYPDHESCCRGWGFMNSWIKGLLRFFRDKAASFATALGTWCRSGGTRGSGLTKTAGCT